MKNHQAGAGRDCKTRLEIPNSQNPSCGHQWYGLRREMEEISRDFWVRYGYVWQSH
ncbi:unnamed protein product, partial [Ascophyllum nodosum]